MKREEYKQRLNELLEEDETLTHGSPDEILYMIDNMVILVDMNLVIGQLIIIF